MTELKTTVHISSSSQSSIAALKDVLAYGRLTSSPPLPSLPPTPSGAPTVPYTLSYPYTYWGGLWVRQRCRGGSSTISPLLRNSGPPSALKQIVHTSSYLYSLFHSVIYNYVRIMDSCWIHNVTKLKGKSHEMECGGPTKST